MTGLAKAAPQVAPSQNINPAGMPLLGLNALSMLSTDKPLQAFDLAYHIRGDGSIWLADEDLGRARIPDR
jgi:hypothetical protein